MLKYSNSKNQIIAKEIADLTINNYHKGLQQKENEKAQDADADNVTNIIVPTANVSIKNKSGYTVKNKMQNKTIASSDKNLIETFMTQSDILDNELHNLCQYLRYLMLNKFMEVLKRVMLLMLML